ncbi:UDP-N-acetylmuramoyl-L-alanine--D-glutamate ligase [Xanthobacter tagetidis]|uniref:UDP-N-acetylmuramoylalanine--D-glutamate ligase n=1 Tax=Xanthobacter tagetidis TaxID=60216 RepID=A0A3L6ZVE8_9HYPH|nr:UDP-N-acetylmuramoyl-L-alanine--D-glutamate ligase [Xanthobacter tagetidis]MBB6308662.1 UDP-N-acetylmuramoylalanine--D-glutamate ligase [Xanthobacter tagetidis]RLP71541.1 UDP-N-acetylmuramoyl-L-alanine--D-glutamate ligase [Xanthobacter tagetidis]
MIPVTVFKDRTVALFGLGGSGIPTALALIAGGARVVAFDDAERSRLKAQAEGIEVQDLRSIDWGGIAALVLAPGVPLTHPAPHWSVALARNAGVEVIGDIELFCRERQASARRSPFIAITGTNGKSTTTALIAHLLRTAGRDVQMGGNIGTAILSLAPPKPGRVHVVECSSYQIDLSPSLDPSVGIQLNITPDHLDRHGTLENYAAVKERLITGVEGGGTAVVGVDDDFSAAMADRAERAGTHVVRVSVRRPLPDGIWRDGESLVVSEGGAERFRLPLGGIGSLRGAHNAQNAAAAFAAVRALGLAPEVIAVAMKRFPGLAHRMEEVGRKGDVLFVNDSKATNADAAERALLSFEDIFWIAGGKPKAGGIDPLAPHFGRVRKAYLIGEAAQDFAHALGGAVAHEIAGTLDQAVAAAARDAEASGLAHPVVLLSPACASFDQYPNFEVRGDAFRDLVTGLPGVTANPKSTAPVAQRAEPARGGPPHGMPHGPSSGMPPGMGGHPAGHPGGKPPGR